MIPLKFGLWWSGKNMSYLRYLTFKSLRHFHPNSEIMLMVSDKYSNNHQWNVEKQDFENNDIKTDYLDKVQDLGVKVIKGTFFEQFAPNFASDLYRWWFLYNFGGFYLDTDQIILKSFESLPLNNDFIYSGYNVPSCGYYTPVGVIGASKQSDIVKAMHENVANQIDVNNYNSAGPFLLKRVLEAKKWTEAMFNAPSSYFYPVPESFMMHLVYDGRFCISNNSYSLHWFGGLPLSQEFNLKYTEEFAKTSNECISVFLRENKII